MSAFVTAINCIDGRVQSPVSSFLKTRFGAQYVDMITCPGPVSVLSKSEESQLVRHLHDSVMISVLTHGSGFIAVAAHYDCAANDLSEAEQRTQIELSILRIRQWHLPAHVVGLWINSCWNVEEVVCDLTANKKDFEHALFCND